MKRKSKIFVSHSLADKSPLLDKFIFDLQNQSNIELWLAEKQIRIGDEISKIIAKAISDCDYFICVIGQLERTWTNIELLLAQAEEQKNQNLKVIKVSLKDFPFRGTVLGAEQKNTIINFGEDYNFAFNELLKIIRVNNSDSIIKFSLDSFTNHKPIIEISYRVNEKLIEYFSNNPEELKVIDRRLFEELIAELFFKFGYKTELTQQTRDGGRDIIAIKYAETNLKYLIECKRPDPGNKIGIRPVRELLGVKQDEKATKAILATTSYFSPDALQFFERNKWELEPKDFDGIMKWIADYKSK